jgi:HAD superfamily hydrolase (TIGR01490 family)
MRLAIFDLDGTLTHASSERLFARYLYEQGCIGWSQALAFMAFLARYAPVYRSAVFKKNKAYLAGLSATLIEEMARRFVRECLLETLYRPAVARLERHRMNGDLVMLLTGTPDFIALPLGELLSLEHIIAAQCAVRDGVFTGVPPLQHPFGREKLRLAREFATSHGTRMDTVVAYANAREDRFLLEEVGTPVAVRPDLTLRGLARRSGWEIIEAAT